MFYFFLKPEHVSKYPLPEPMKKAPAAPNSNTAAPNSNTAAPKTSAAAPKTIGR